MRRSVALGFGVSALLLSQLIITIGCSDDGGSSADDNTGGAGTGGKGTGGAGTGGAGGEGTGGSKATGGTSTGGTSTGGTSTGGSDSTGGMGGMPMGGMAGMGGMGGMGGADGGEPVNYLENPSFELGAVGQVISGWEEDGDVNVSYTENSPTTSSGARRLTHWVAWEETMPDAKFGVSTYQTLTGIPNGTYTFSVWVVGDNWADVQLFAEGFDAAGSTLWVKRPAPSNSAFTRVEVTDIEVTNNQIKVGLYTYAATGTWVSFDGAALVEQ
jgi:hypothetical protein